MPGPPIPTGEICGVCGNTPVAKRHRQGHGDEYLCAGHAITASYGGSTVWWWDPFENDWVSHPVG